ncbi:hypothetical protein GGU10DRAFT_366757 [Lentinula aff. detonsa]|uniref:Uncharacterized protein n=1 Tax=Lentinula aff. detonsa TaxID=2804958 RepID=A0AA38L3C7_9AGAR|nr:hypothetical protein GGU10DRAFT_366757 [Lentinula aff. detonsa]
MLVFRIHAILTSIILILACWSTFAHSVPIAPIGERGTGRTVSESLTTRDLLSIYFEYTGTGRIQSSLVQNACKQSVQDLLNAKKLGLGISSSSVQIKAKPLNSLHSSTTFSTDVPFRFTFRGQMYTAVAKGNGLGEIGDSNGVRI